MINGMKYSKKDIFYKNRWDLKDYFDFNSNELNNNDGTANSISNEIISPELNSTNSENQFPPEIPILPLRGVVIYPQTAVPLPVGQPRSIKLVDDAINGTRVIGLLTSKDIEKENPGPEDLYSVGTLAIIHRLFRAPDGTIRLLVQGMQRFKIEEYTKTEPYLFAKIQPYPEIIEQGIEIEALLRSVREQFSHIAEMVTTVPQELVESVNSIIDPLQTVYTIANFQRMELATSQSILELDNLEEKLKTLLSVLTRETEVLELGRKIQNEAKSEIDKVQREYYLREQAKAIQKELGEQDEQTVEVEEFKKRIKKAKMPDEAEKQAIQELDRLSRLPTAAAEYGVIRTYLDWLVSLPWSVSTKDKLDIAAAREVLEEDHYGLEDVKERILEFLAVQKLRLERHDELQKHETIDYIRRDRTGIILCFIGPPGVGKTSLGKSITRALGRKFIHLSLGGIRDEAEIRGHRRTYIGAMPGRIIQAIRRVESKNPVFMLDEIDKLGTDFRGDPGSALLEVLDPEQNAEFRDNYLEVAFDLSQVMFITTANQINGIPLPLLDRMEVISIAGYTETEKLAIACNYLVPRQLRENGLREDELKFTDDAILTIVRKYTREAGVRNLERELGNVCRKVATRITEGKKIDELIGAKQIKKLLGREKFFPTEEIARRTAIPGVATGLAWTPFGGDILFIEATSMTGSKGFQITGSIGNVMQESARTALSYVRSRAKEFNIDPDFFNSSDIHIHVPAGAQPKDGPSAGTAIVTALVSLLTKRAVKSDLAMTGEISLRGQVLPVGGIKEKSLAAHRAGLKTVIIPKENKPDLDELPGEVLKSIHFISVEKVEEVIKLALEKPKNKNNHHHK